MKLKFFLFLLLSIFFSTLFSSAKAAGDTTPPITNYELSGTIGSNSWYISSVNVDLSSYDLESGVLKTEYWVDSGTHTTVSYNSSDNLIKNPSFEVGTGSNPTNWVKVGTANLARVATPFDGSFSAKIDSGSSGWSAFDTALADAPPLTSGKTYVAAAYVKTSGLGGAAKIRILLSDGTLVTQSSSQTSDTDWKFISKVFTAFTSEPHIIEVGLEGSGIVYWDAVSLYEGASASETNFTVSSQGSHLVNFFSTNNDLISETIKQTSEFKIDTNSPTNWREFAVTEAGNDHTFIISIKVDDVTSGLDPSSAYYNYTVDGVNFGHYSNTINCSSTWIPEDPSKDPSEAGSGWRSLSVNPNTAGAATATLTTDAIDFCNSNWDLNKAVKFRIKDMAGNEARKEQVLNGAWLRVEGGDFYSRGSVNFKAQAQASDLVSSGTFPINNLVSDKNWYVAPYASTLNETYSKWFSKFKTKSPLPAGKLPLVNGVYFQSGNYTIDLNTIPAGLATAQNLAAVIFIKEDLTINKNFSLDKSSAYLFVIGKDLRIDKKVDNIAGYYIVDGKIDTGYNGNDGEQLKVSGGLVGNGDWHLGKSLTANKNLTTPAEVIAFPINYFVNKNLINLITGGSKFIWTEVAP